MLLVLFEEEALPVDSGDAERTLPTGIPPAMGRIAYFCEPADYPVRLVSPVHSPATSRDPGP